MNTRQSLSVLTVATLGLVSLSSSVSAFTLSHISTDAEMAALLKDLAFVAEGRIGDLAGAATYELDLHEDDPGIPQATAQFNWTNGVPQAFELTYDAISNLVNYTVGNEKLAFSYTDPFSDIFIRTRSVL